MKKRGYRRAAACLLAGALLTNTTTVFAAGDSTPKEEVVYAMLDGSGEVNGIYVVNSFTDSDIVDYGSYTSVSNLNTTDEINVDGDKITIHTDADKLYYQGNMDTDRLPWKVDIRYYMDGVEKTPEEIGGMSGQLKITIDITQNTAADERFWEGYALQATVSLDTALCRNITAPGATMANVGANKQLSYIILPGTGANLEIEAQVTDFVMDAIAINGVKLNLNLSVDSLTGDDSALEEQLKQIQDAIAALNDGAGQVAEGSSSLYTGADQVNSGTASLNQGAASLNQGIARINQALTELNAQSGQLTGGSAQVMEALNTIQSSLSSVSLDASSLSQLVDSSNQISSGIGSLVEGAQKLQSGINTYKSGMAASGGSGDEAYIEQHKNAIAALEITTAQRTIYEAYQGALPRGAEPSDAERQAAVSAAAAKAGELANPASSYDLATQSEAGEFITKAQQSLADSDAAQWVTQYLTTAGKLIAVEALLTADSQLLQALIPQFDAGQSGTLANGLTTLQSSYTAFNSAIQSMANSLSSLAGNMTTLKNGIDTLVSNYTTLDQGLGEYTAAVNTITEGFSQVVDGALALTGGTADLYQGTGDLLSGIESLREGSTSLYEGTGEFYDQTSDIDSKINDVIQDTLGTVSGEEGETVSFADSRNTNVDSVLFVLKTDPIEKTVQETAAAGEEEHLSFWQKFLRLFNR